MQNGFQRSLIVGPEGDDCCNIIITGSQALLQIVNLVFASPGLLLLGLVLRLAHPAHLFLNVVASFRPPSTSA